MSSFTFPGIRVYKQRNIVNPIQTQADTAGILIPHLNYIGDNVSNNEILERTRKITNSTIVSDYLFTQSKFKRNRRTTVDSRRPERKILNYDLKEIYEGYSFFKNKNEEFIKESFRVNFLLNVGEFLTIDPFRRKFNVLNEKDFSALFNVNQPHFDILVVNNKFNENETNFNRYAIRIPNLPLELLHDIKVTQPQVNADKFNAIIEPGTPSFFLGEKLNLSYTDADDLLNQVLIKEQTVNEFKKLSYVYQGGGIHEITTVKNTAYSLLGLQNNYKPFDSVKEMWNRGYIANKLYNSNDIDTDSRKVFITTSDVFSENYINVLFYATYVEIFSKIQEAKDNNAQYIVKTILLGIIKYALKFNDFSLNENKIYFPSLGSDRPFGGSIETGLLEFYKRINGGPTSSITFSDFDRLINLNDYASSPDLPFGLAYKINNLDFVKANIKLIIKNITFVKELNDEAFKVEGDKITINSNNIFVTKNIALEVADIDDIVVDEEEEPNRTSSTRVTPPAAPPPPIPKATSDNLDDDFDTPQEKLKYLDTEIEGFEETLRGINKESEPKFFRATKQFLDELKADRAKLQQQIRDTEDAGIPK